jgi:trehalose-phosphatase
VPLEAVTVAPDEAGIFLDFDGVLAPIVPRPEDAYPPQAARDELARLNERYGLVAVVSGRGGDDVRERVGVDGLVYVGSHGLELDRNADRWRHQIVEFAAEAPWPRAETELKGLSVAFHFRHRPDEQEAVRELEELADRAREDGLVYVGSHGLELDRNADRWRHQIVEFAAEAPWPRAETELKGLSVAFHFRHRPDEQEAVRELEELADRAREDGLAARFGRRVLEVLPPVGSNKGTAVRSLLRGAGLSRAFVAGDDTTDLDAFMAVEELPHRVRVAVLAPESPPVLAEHAELVVGSTEEFLDVLRRL